MTSELILEPPPTHMARACAFTLATALTWLGHDCTGGCPAQTLELRARVWFIHDAPQTVKDQITTFVVVRFGQTPTPGSVTPQSALIRRVNECVRRDGIHVRERETTTWDSALDILTDNAEQRTPLLAGAAR